MHYENYKNYYKFINEYTYVKINLNNYTNFTIFINKNSFCAENSDKYILFQNGIPDLYNTKFLALLEKAMLRIIDLCIAKIIICNGDKKDWYIDIVNIVNNNIKLSTSLHYTKYENILENIKDSLCILDKCFTQNEYIQKQIDYNKNLTLKSLQKRLHNELIDKIYKQI